MSTTSAITIGNFDGVHLGHRELVRVARQAVGETGKVTALVFDPHPLTVLRPEVAPPRLSHLAQRRRWLGQAGANQVVSLSPSPELLQLEPPAFLERMTEEHAPDVVVEGGDFHFGRRRAGSVATLRALGPALGFEVIEVGQVQAALTDNSLVIASSSLSRWLVARGRVGDATRLLGRPYALLATVVTGEKRGRELGFPTANLDAGDQLLPADGIYAGTARCPDGRSYPAAISVGTKPTFGQHPRLCEAHLLDFDGGLDAYGWTIELEITSWLRDQLAYDDIDALLAQIGRDIEQVRGSAPMVEVG